MSRNDNDAGKIISNIPNDTPLTSIDASANNQDESEASVTMSKSNAPRCKQLRSETLSKEQLKTNPDKLSSDINAHSAQLDNNNTSKKTDQNNALETGIINIVENNGEPIMEKSDIGSEPNTEIVLEDKNNQIDTASSSTSLSSSFFLSTL